METITPNELKVNSLTFHPNRLVAYTRIAIWTICVSFGIFLSVMFGDLSSKVRSLAENQAKLIAERTPSDPSAQRRTHMLEIVLERLEDQRWTLHRLEHQLETFQRERGVGTASPATPTAPATALEPHTPSVDEATP